jgi:hypothetical protein
MKNLTRLLLIPVAIISFIACNKKKDDTPTPTATTSSSKIVGKWLITQRADDWNKNTIVDSNEKYNDSSETWLLNFGADGKGGALYTTDGLSSTIDYIWTISADDKNLRIIGLDDGDTSEILVAQLTATDMLWQEDIGSGILSWTMFKKQ